MKDSMFFEEGKAWGRSRRLISPNLSGHSIATMLPVVAKVKVTLLFLFLLLPRIKYSQRVLCFAYYAGSCVCVVV